MQARGVSAAHGQRELFAQRMTELLRNQVSRRFACALQICGGLGIVAPVARGLACFLERRFAVPRVRERWVRAFSVSAFTKPSLHIIL